MSAVSLVRHPESVVVLAIDEGSVAVVTQPRPGAPGPTVELPAGSIEPGESPREAAARELREECSLAAAHWRELGAFWAVPAYSTEHVHVFEARTLSHEAGEPDADEHITVGRRAVGELPDALSDAISIAAFALWSAGR